MLLSIQQRYILELLRNVGVLKRQQLLILTREKFRQPDLEITPERLDTMLYQLKMGSELRLNGDIVQLSMSEPDFRCLEAIDIMLELSKGRQRDFKVHLSSPAVLKFLYGTDRLRVMTVAVLTNSPDSNLVDIERHREERIVWFAEDGKMPNELLLPPKHFFAARLEDGTHRFYGG